MPNTTWIGITNVSIFFITDNTQGVLQKKEDDRQSRPLHIISSFDYLEALIAD